MNSFNHVNDKCLIIKHFDITVSDSKKSVKMGTIIKLL